MIPKKNKSKIYLLTTGYKLAIVRIVYASKDYGRNTNMKNEFLKWSKTNFLSTTQVILTFISKLESLGHQMRVFQLSQLNFFQAPMRLEKYFPL